MGTTAIFRREHGKSIILGLGLLGLLSGCSLDEYRQDADNEALDIIKEKQEAVFGEDRPFQVEAAKETPRTKLLASIERAKTKGAGPLEPLKLDLKRSLEVAALCSRDFQNQKESLFLSSLSLSSTRWEYQWNFTLSGRAGVDGNRRDADASGSVSLGFSKAMSLGASMLSSLLHTFSRGVTAAHNWDTSSLLSIGLTQPLIRGFGSMIAMEGLTQAERNVVYSMRSFERFRRRHVVQLTSTYYSLLQQSDRIDIEKDNLKNLEANLARQEEMEKASKVKKIDVDQNRQSVLRSRATLLRLQESLSSSLDAFKITLGLPLEAKLELDRTEFTKLQDEGLATRNIDLAKATKIALENRLDLKTEKDQVADAKRQVTIAADALKLGLDLELDLDVPATGNKSGKPDWKNVTMGAGIDWDLPIGKTRQRNSYRSAIISYERSLRDYELLKDTVKREIRLGYREINQILQDYEIQKMSVALAKSRVQQTIMEQQAARARMDQVLDAQEDLVAARSSLSNLLLDYLTANLELLRDLDLLKLSPEGLTYDSRLETYKSLYR